MRTYQEYKCVDYEYVESLPKHWRLRKIKNFANTSSGGTPSTAKSEYWGGNIPWLPSGKIQNCDLYEADIFITELGLSESSAKLFPRNSVLIALTGATRANVAYLKFDSAANQSVTALYPNNSFIPRFLFYILLNSKDYFLKKTIGGAQGHINENIVKNFKIPFPPKDEQEAIASFLDDKTSKLDKVINNKRKQVELLKEYEKIVINQAVTKGLNPNVEMKDSGIKWLNHIAKRFKIKRIKTTSYVKSRIGWQGLTSKEYRDEGPYLITGTNFENGKINWETCHHVDEERYLQDPYIQIQNEDVLVTKDGSIGKVAFIEGFYGKATLNSGVFVIRPENNIYVPKFMFWVLNSELFNNFIEYIKTGSTISHLYQKTFVNFYFPLPDKEEQEAIVAFLDSFTEKIKSAIDIIEDEIKRLEEYKRVLINDCVTGKMKVVA